MMNRTVLLVALSMTASLTACGAKDIEPTVEGGALTFEAPDLDGNVVNQDDERFADKVVLVDIWGTWCPPCRDSIPNLVKMQEELGEEGLVIVGVAFEDEPDTDTRRTKVRAFAEKLEISYLLLDGGTTSDVDAVFPTLKGFRGFPTMVIIGRDGKVAHANTVFVPREEKKIRKEVERALEAGSD